MVLNPAIVMVLLLAGASLTLAAPKGAEVGTEPVLSPLGIKRAEENLKILEQNIRDMKANSEIAERNVQTLQAEMKELDKLQQEHTEMRLRCEEYLSSAKVQIAKNDAELKKAALNERNLASSVGSDKKERLSQMEKVRRDKAELANWKNDAQTKVARVRELIGEIGESERQLEVRRASLRGQVKQWQTRKVEFEEQIDKFILRRAEVEKLTKK